MTAGSTESSPAADTSLVVSATVAPEFEQLYLAEYSTMVSLARRLVDSVERAEELVQDAFAQVYARWGHLDEPGGYLRTAVVNRARSELRKRGVRRRVGLEHPSESDPGDRDYLLDALDRLPAKRKAALVLRYYADLGEREIAETMGVRPGTVKSLLSRGLADLRKVIDK